MKNSDPASENNNNHSEKHTSASRAYRDYASSMMVKLDHQVQELTHELHVARAWVSTYKWLALAGWVVATFALMLAKK